MRRVFILGTAAAALAFAQEPPKKDVMFQSFALAGAPGTFEFIAAEGAMGTAVKNAPYSAEAVTETTQVLADGNRIVNKTSSMMYRDSQGRTRREQKFGPIGHLMPSTEAQSMIFLSDPANGTTTVLNTNNKTATTNKVMMRRRIGSPDADGKAVAELQQFSRVTRAKAPEAGESRTMIITNNEEHTAHMTGGGVIGGIVSSAGPDHVVSYRVTSSGVSSKEAKREDLGTQNIEGVVAKGTRMTMTIPAGAIGNERPIETVTETWYSPELQMVVMTKTTDPRNGETVYKLTNISRSEPAGALFEVPADYSVQK